MGCKHTHTKRKKEGRRTPPLGRVLESANPTKIAAQACLSVCLHLDPKPDCSLSASLLRIARARRSRGCFPSQYFSARDPAMRAVSPLLHSCDGFAGRVSQVLYSSSYKKKAQEFDGGLWIARLCCTYYSNAPRVSHLSLNDALGHRRGAALRHHACGQPSLPPSLLSRSQEFGARHTRAPRPRAWCRQDAALFFKKAKIKSLPLHASALSMSRSHDTSDHTVIIIPFR